VILLNETSRETGETEKPETQNLKVLATVIEWLWKNSLSPSFLHAFRFQMLIQTMSNDEVDALPVGRLELPHEKSVALHLVASDSLAAYTAFFTITSRCNGKVRTCCEQNKRNNDAMHWLWTKTDPHGHALLNSMSGYHWGSYISPK
jgi:hypothetical protein